MNKEELEEFIFKTVKEVMNIDIKNVDLDKRIDSISEWDSFNNLMLISKFQDSLKVEFSVQEIESVQTLKEMFDLIKRKYDK